MESQCKECGKTQENCNCIPEEQLDSFTKSMLNLQEESQREIKDTEALIGDIHVKETLIFKNRKDFEQLKLKIDVYKAKLLKDISKLENPDGKKIYTNEVGRKGELKKTLAEDNEYKEMETKHISLEETIALDCIALETMKRKFRFFEAVSRLGL